MAWRRSELLLLAYFLYASIVALAGPAPAQVAYIAVGMNVAVSLWLFLFAWAGTIGGGYAQGIVRDWVVFPLVWLAYREMGWLVSAPKDLALAAAWFPMDRLVLEQLGLNRLVETGGSAVATLLALSIPLAAVLPVLGLIWIYTAGLRRLVDDYHSVYVLASLMVFAMFPYFASAAPRALLADASPPPLSGPLYGLSRLVLEGYSNPATAYPSALIAGAMGAAFGLFRVTQGNRIAAWIGLATAAAAVPATIYWRFDYAVGAIVSSICATASLALSWTYRKTSPPA